MCKVHKRRANETCEQCGRGFYAAPARRAGGGGRFCCRDCYIVHQNRTVTDPARFWAKVDRRGAGQCWPWIGATSFGYGVLRWGGRNRRATHVALEVIDGSDVPSGMEVCHSCDNPGCVNPAHLWLGTRADNLADMVAKGRSAASFGSNALRGPRRLTDGQVGEIRALRSAGEKRRLVAARFGIHISHVDRIVRGLRRRGP